MVWVQSSAVVGEFRCPSALVKRSAPRPERSGRETQHSLELASVSRKLTSRRDLGRYGLGASLRQNGGKDAPIRGGPVRAKTPEQLPAPLANDDCEVLVLGALVPAIPTAHDACPFGGSGVVQWY